MRRLVKGFENKSKNENGRSSNVMVGLTSKPNMSRAAMDLCWWVVGLIFLLIL